jgi:hypothetical protein
MHSGVKEPRSALELTLDFAGRSGVAFAEMVP